MRRNFSAYVAKVMSNPAGLGGDFAVYFTLGCGADFRKKRGALAA